VEQSILGNSNQSTKEIKTIATKMEKEKKLSSEKIEELTNELAKLNEKYQRELSEVSRSKESSELCGDELKSSLELVLFLLSRMFL
jgi:hypothetical protein